MRPSTYHRALDKCAIRYLEMCDQSPLIDPDDKVVAFCRELLDASLRGDPVPKLCRWLGYIQGVLIERGLTTVQAERDWTRPLFRPLDFPEPGA